MMRRKSNKAGFTLVELSIVLVIIGLIIGGVLTGRQIMQNAQVTNAINSIQAFEAQFQTYVQNYGAIPGNDINATSRFGKTAVNGSGSGTLVGKFDDSATSGSETVLLWSDLRAAGLVKGALGNTTQPANPFGGLYGFQYGAFNSVFTTNVLCLNDVPGDAASAIDSRLDDGIGNTGSIQAEDTANTLSASYDATKTYTLCVRM